MDTASLVRELRRPEAYPSAPREVGFLQTHISLLFFAGDRVYKVKKPVDLGFLDFTTLERRRHFCAEEVRLNRRLAPTVYLGVVPVALGREGRVRISGEGDVIDWAVEMIRLPEERMLAGLLDRGEIDNDLVHALVSLLADFHARAATGAGVDEFGTPEAIATNMRENFEQLRPFVGPPRGEPGAGPRALSAAQHGYLVERGERFVDDRRELLQRRVRDGRIREGHGDLHAGNVCCTREGVVAYDCIEFNRRFRCADVACDLAFLAMDLDDRGFPGFSKYLVKRYSIVAGDLDLVSLIGFYKGYRAVVRGKVAAMTAADPALGVVERGERVREAMRYLQLAVAYELPPAMILMCGLPASGKSWLAERLGRALRAVLLVSDIRRKVLARMETNAPSREGYGAGLYAPAMKEKTYDSLLDDAVDALRSGHSAVVDATFSRRRFREPFVEAAARARAPCFLVHVTADEGVTRERLARRASEAKSTSDADLEVYLRERAAFEPPGEIPADRVLEIVSGAAPPEEASSLLIDRMIADARPG